MFLVWFYSSNLRAFIIAPSYLPAIDTDEDAMRYMPKIFILTEFDKSHPNYENMFEAEYGNLDIEYQKKVRLQGKKQG